MAKNFKCTEIQLTLHLIIVVIIGILIGASLVSSSDEIDSTLEDKTREIKGIYTDINKQHEVLIRKFKSSYDKYKALVYNGAEVSCKKIGNYAIDTSKNKEITIDLVETFSKPPKVFMSINGFDFQPKVIKAENVVETIDFHIKDTSDRSFTVLIESKDDDLKIEDFDRIDICYLAFTDTEKDFEPLKQTK